MSTKATKIVSHILQNNTGVTAICTNINTLTRPQAVELPAILIQRISTQGSQSKGKKSGTEKVRVQLNIYAKTVAAVNQLAEAVRDALFVENTSVNTHYVFAISFENEFDDFDDDTTNDGVYRVIQDYFVTHG